MKIAAVVLSFALLLGAAWSQSVPPIFSPPYAGPLIDDTDMFKQSAPAGATVRFTIVQTQGETILLDTSKGDTWQLISEKSDDHNKLIWKPIPKMQPNDERRLSPRCFEEELPEEDEESFNPFRDGT